MRIAFKILTFLLPIAILIVFGIFGSGVISGLKAPPEASDESPRGLAVFTEAAALDAIRLDVDTQGEVRPKREIVVAPQIAGRIAYVAPNFQEGGFIRNGQVLVRLEAADYELGVVRAQSGVASAEQVLAREIAESENARQDLEDLGITDASPLARREPQLAQARASLNAAKAQLRDAELALERTAVRAPFDGRVRELSANIGQFVGAGSALGAIFSSDVVEIELPLTDAELGRLGLSLAFEETAEVPGPKVTFSAEVAGQPRVWRGRITRTAAAVDPRTRLISAIADVEDPYGKAAEESGMPMAPGLFVNASIEGMEIDSVIRIPRAGLRGLDEVYVGDPQTGRLEVREVTVIESNPSGAYIMRGLEPGEYVITSPMQSVTDGQRISFADPELQAIADANADRNEAGSETAEASDKEASR